MNRFRIRNSKDRHSSEVLSGAVTAFLLRGAGAGLTFSLNVVIARLLGAEGSGLYFIALSVTMIGTVVARMGLDNSLLRFIAASASQGDWGRVKGIFAQGMTTALGSTLIISFCCFIMASVFIPEVFGMPELLEPFRWMSIGIISFSFMMLLSESIKGLKRIREAVFISGVLYPLVGLVVIWPLVSLFGVVGASIAFVAATGISAASGLMLWKRAMSPHKAYTKKIDPFELRRSSRPLWVMAVSNQAVLPWAPLIFLGIWGTAEESGIFGAATRVSMLITFVLVAVNTALAPKFAELYADGNIDLLRILLRRFTLLIIIITTPLLFTLITNANWVMGLFGVEFMQGGIVLVILALGQAVNALTGPVGNLLIMSGHERDVRNSSLVGSTILLFLSFALTPSMGMEGAAIASAGATSVANIFVSYFVWKRLGILTIPLASEAK